LAPFRVIGFDEEVVPGGKDKVAGPGRVDELKREIGLEAVMKTAETVAVKEHELEAMKGTAGDGRS
jgi:hypothetical protein